MFGNGKSSLNENDNFDPQSPMLSANYLVILFKSYRESYNIFAISEFFNHESLYGERNL